jgi:hypothetical protein
LGKTGVEDSECSLVVLVEQCAPTSSRSASLAAERDTLVLVDAINTAFGAAFPGDVALSMLVVLQGFHERSTLGGLVIDGVVESLSFD